MTTESQREVADAREPRSRLEDPAVAAQALAVLAGIRDGTERTWTRGELYQTFGSYDPAKGWDPKLWPARPADWADQPITPAEAKRLEVQVHETPALMALIRRIERGEERLIPHEEVMREFPELFQDL